MSTATTASPSPPPCLEIGIAISTIAIITRKHWPWAMSAILGATGVVVAISAFV